MYGDRLPSLNPDLVIGCGDLPFDYLEYLVSRLDVPLLYVPGNHDASLVPPDMTWMPLRSELPPLTREKLNPWLEQWYNEGGFQPPVFVPYHFLFGPRTHEYPEVHVGGEVDLERIKPETIEAVGQILADRLQRPLSDEEQTADTSLDEFIQDVHARIAVVSVGPNRYGHPVERVLAELIQDGMRVFRTDRSGDVTVAFRPDGLFVTTGR